MPEDWDAEEAAHNLAIKQRLATSIAAGTSRAKGKGCGVHPRTFRQQCRLPKCDVCKRPLPVLTSALGICAAGLARPRPSLGRAGVQARRWLQSRAVR